MHPPRFQLVDTAGDLNSFRGDGWRDDRLRTQEVFYLASNIGGDGVSQQIAGLVGNAFHDRANRVGQNTDGAGRSLALLHGFDCRLDRPTAFMTEYENEGDHQLFDRILDAAQYAKAFRIDDVARDAD